MPVKLRGNFLGGTPAHWEENEWQQAEQSFWSAIRSGKIAFDGDFGGPGWSEGKYQNSVRSYWTARSAQDQRSKEHDAVYADVGADGEFTNPSLIDADWSYAKNSIGTGFKNSLAGLAVGAQGAARSAVKAATGATGKKRFREEDAAQVVPLPDSWKSRQVRRKFAGDSDITGNTDSRPMETEIADEVTEEQGGGAAGEAGAASNKGRETAIMRAPKRIRWNIADYNHTKLIFTFCTGNGQIDTGTFSTPNTDLLFQMNGPHDVIATNALYTSINTNVAAGENTSGSNQPKGWAFWKALYTQYTVLNCEYDITAIVTDVGTADTDGPAGLAAATRPHSMLFFADEVGPASNDYNATGLEIMTDMQVKHHKILYSPSFYHKSYLFGATNDVGITVERPVYQHTFSGNANSKTFEKHAKEITDDDANHIWQAVTANPTLNHRLRVGVRPLSNHVQTGDVIFYQGRLIYTVQFRQKQADMHGYRMSKVPA